MKKAKKELLQKRAEAALVVRTPPAEQLLIEEIPSIGGARILCTSPGRGQFAEVAGSYLPQAQVICQFFERFALRHVSDAFHVRF